MSVVGIERTLMKAGPESRTTTDPSSIRDDRWPLSHEDRSLILDASRLALRQANRSESDRAFVGRRHSLLPDELRWELEGMERVAVTFAFDSEVLPPALQEQVVEGVRRLHHDPDDGAGNLVLDVSGHTDRLGSEQYNRTLAARRASHVAELLNDQGFRTRVWAYGASCPRAEDLTGDGRDLPRARALNRRVVVSVAGVDGPDALQQCLPTRDPQRAIARG